MKLLIIDDSSSVYRRLIDLIGGAEALTALAVARSISEASTKLARFQPDTVVLDYHLPDGNAIDAIRHIRLIEPDTRILVFSNCQECRGKVMSVGADAFYDKSFEFETLVNELIKPEPKYDTSCHW